MTSLEFVFLSYGFFSFVCAVTTIIIMLLKKKVFNRSSAHYQAQQAAGQYRLVAAGVA